MDTLPEPIITDTLEVQYAYALTEGPIIVSVPGERLRGFNDLSASLLYCDAVGARLGQPPIQKVLIVTDKGDISIA